MPKIKTISDHRTKNETQIFSIFLIFDTQQLKLGLNIAVAVIRQTRSFDAVADYKSAYLFAKPDVMTDEAMEYAGSNEYPVVFKWYAQTHPAKHVYLTGSWDNWRRKIPLGKSTNDFSTIIDLMPGRYEYKFLVDGKWMVDDTVTKAENQMGTHNNVISIDDADFDVNQRMINVFVRTLSGKIITLRVRGSDTVASVNAKIASREGIACRQLRLQYGPKQLDEEATLEDYHVGNRSTLDLSLRLKGGDTTFRWSERMPLMMIACSSVGSSTFVLMTMLSGKLLFWEALLIGLVCAVVGAILAAIFLYCINGFFEGRNLDQAERHHKEMLGRTTELQVLQNPELRSIVQRDPAVAARFQLDSEFIKLLSDGQPEITAQEGSVPSTSQQNVPRKTNQTIGEVKWAEVYAVKGGSGVCRESEREQEERKEKEEKRNE